MKRKIKFLVFIIIFQNYCFAQKVSFTAKKILVNNQIEGNAYFKNFNKTIKFIYNKNLALTKDSSEEVFYNFYKINSLENLKKFFADSIPKTYKKNNYIQLMDIYKKNPEKNFYELDYNIILTNGSDRYSYIRYINHNELFPKPIASIVYLEYINERWFIKDIGNNLDLGIFLSSVKSDILEKILSKSLSQTESKIIAPYFVNDKVDLKKLSRAFFDLKKKNNDDPLVKLLYDTQYSIF